MTPVRVTVCGKCIVHRDAIFEAKSIRVQVKLIPDLENSAALLTLTEFCRRPHEGDGKLVLVSIYPEYEASVSL